MSSQASVEQTAAKRERDADRDGGDAAALPKDDVFHLLQNGRRRAVLRYLAERDETERFVMRDVAEAVAAWENDTTVPQLSSDQRQRVYIALYQSHLPKLDEHDVIDYDQDRGHIVACPLASVLEPYLGDGLDAPQTLTVDEEEPSDGRDDGLLSRFGLRSR